MANAPDPADFLIRAIADEPTERTPVGNALRVARSQDRRGEFVRTEVAAKREKLLLSFFDHLPGGVFVVDASGAPFFANELAVELLGPGARPGSREPRASLFMPGEDKPLPDAMRPDILSLRGERFGPRELEVGEKRVPILVSSAPVYREGLDERVAFGIMTVEDFRKQRELEANLQQTQRLEAVGRLAGGVAHDFNNLLTAIFSFGQFLLDEHEEGSQPHGDVLEILKAARRAQALTRQLLTFSKRQSVEPRALDLNEVVGDLDKMLRRIAPDVEIATFLGQDLAPVRMDPSALEQVIVNLTVNARDAMPGGGRLTVETSNLTLDEPYTQSNKTLPIGDYVVLSVADDGVGMPAEVQQHIFEPFFTTKGPGEGTGLGLATCYGIVQQAGGQIWVYSEVGHGTIFKVVLPRTGEVPVSPLDDDDGARPKGAGESVLLVDDDEQVRRSAERVLRDAGYNVEAYGDANAARAALGRESARFEILITDVVLPGATAYTLIESAQRQAVPPRVLTISGFTEHANPLADVGVASFPLLTTPFTPRALLEKVRDVLQSPQRPALNDRVLVVEPDVRLLIALHAGLGERFRVEEVSTDELANALLTGGVVGVVCTREVAEAAKVDESLLIEVQRGQAPILEVRRRVMM